MNELVKTFGNSKQWVNWKLLENTKIPYYSKTIKASTTDPKTWKTYEKSNEDVNNGSNGFTGIGFVFPLDGTILGVDIDHCLKDKLIIHEKADLIKKFIDKSKTYCEVSPSGTGLHFFFKITESFKVISNKKAPFEIYSSGRYFTVTEQPYNNQIPVRTITTKEANEILSIIGYPWGKATSSDDTLIKKMFASKTGKKIETLYNGDISLYKNDESSADMALCSYLAFWTSKNAVQMERIWLASPLGKREKTEKRKDYRDRTISNAIEKCTEIYESNEFLFTLNREKEKIVILNTENICRVIRTHIVFAKTFRFDIFKNIYERQVFTPRSDVPFWRGLEDNDAIDVQTQIQILFLCFARVGKDMVYDAILKVSKENAIDSASDYIKSLKWDGGVRLDTWLKTTYGAEDNAYSRAVASNWLKGLVKRIVEPGCKFDYVLVLEGEQGTKKSTSLGILGKNWYVETTMSTDTKDFFMQFQGKVIIEFSEGETLSRTEIKRMKAIISTQSDKYRLPYERASQDFPRRCVFAMTTNQTEYLKDETGNRRWFPISLGIPVANVEWLEENRDQLFAEAYHRITVLKENVYEMPEEETKFEQMKRRISDPNSDLVSHWYANTLSSAAKENGITIYQVYKEAMNNNFVSKPLDKYTEMSIAGILKDTLCLIRKRKMVDGVNSWRWFDDKDIVSDVEIMTEDILAKMDKTR